MMWLFVILFAVTCLLLALLFSPVLVEIDSDSDVYRLRYGWFACGSLVADSNGPAVRLQVLGFPKQWGLDALLSKARSATKSTFFPTKKKSVRKRTSVSRKKMIAVARAIEFRRLEVDLDTGSYIRNAWLFPVFYLASRGARRLRINFSGRTIVHAYVRAVPAKLLWAFLRA